MFFKDKSVLVTGGTGFCGTHLVEELLKQGAKVRVPIHRRPLIHLDPNIETINVDLTTEEGAAAAVKGMEFVCHAAGIVGSAAVTPDYLVSAVTGNLILMERMLRAASHAEVDRFLIMSSSTVYPALEHPVKEEEAWSGPTHPSYFGYGWMWRYIEKLAEFVSNQTGMKIALARPTAVYGRWDNFDPKTSHVVPALIRKAVEKHDPYEVWGTGDEVRDFIHVSDLAKGCLLLIEKHATCDPVNLGYGKVITIKEIADNILKSAGHTDAMVEFNSSRPTAIPFRMVDIGKAQDLLGYAPEVSLEDGLSDTVQWYKERVANSP